ncbi:TonB-dependent receptor [Candidatus Poribacteria bacterium]|nr:TonB-dependent receptor [Candidatus Poribacteria bacterium]
MYVLLCNFQKRIWTFNFFGSSNLNVEIYWGLFWNRRSYYMQKIRLNSLIFRSGSGQYLVIVLFAVLALCGSLRAEVTDESETATEELPTILVTGTRITKEPIYQPYAFYRTTDKELGERIGRTVLDRLNYGPGIFVQRTAPNQASPFIRGLTGEQTLLMIDGIRFSHAMMRPGPNQYSALIPGVSVHALDAILGSSSTVNGSDGLTGALDYQLAPAGRGVTSIALPWVESRVDSGNGGTLRLGIDGMMDDWAHSIEFSGSMFHDRVGGEDFRNRVFAENKDAYNEIPNTAYDELAGGLRLAYFGLDKHLLEMDAGHTRQLDAPRPGGYAENSGKTDRLYRYFDPQEFSYLHLRDQWRMRGLIVDQLQTTFWWHQFGEKQFRSSIRDSGTDSERIRRREYNDTLNAYGADMQVTTLLGSEEQHELTWGGTFIYEMTDNNYSEFRTPSGIIDPSLLSPHNPEDWPNKTSVPDGSIYMSLGFFAQDDWQITSVISLLAGARYSRYDWSFGDVDGGADDVTGSLRGIWDMTDYHHIFAGVSKGLRAPNLNNLAGAVDRGSSGQPATGNPDLEPEISYTYEAGWKWQKDRNSIAFTAFKTDIVDLIQRDFSLAEPEFTNVEGADISGLESVWDYGVELGEIHRLALVGAASLVDATKKIPIEAGNTIEDNISRANRMYGRIGLKYEQDRNWWWLTQFRWHDDYNKVSTHPSDADADDIRLTVAGNPDGSMPGYIVFDVMCGWRSDEGNHHIGFFIENIADKTYREPGTGTDGVGRSIGITSGFRL